MKPVNKTSQRERHGNAEDRRKNEGQFRQGGGQGESLRRGKEGGALKKDEKKGTRLIKKGWGGEVWGR